MLALVVTGTLGRAVYAYPTWMSATAKIKFDGGFGGAANNDGPFVLPYDPAPSVSISDTIMDTGDFSNYSRYVIGGSEFFDSLGAEVLLAPGSGLFQDCPDPGDFNPAKVTLDVNGLVRVDDWSPGLGYFQVPVHMYVGSYPSFVELNVAATFTEYIGHPDGTPTRYIAQNLTISQDVSFSSPGSFWPTLYRSIPLPDILLTPDEESAGLAGFSAFTIHAVDTVLDPGEKAGNSFSLNFGGNPVPPAALQGDFNEDGVVDAADYVFWRKFNGMQSDYNVWRAHFGQSSGSGSSASLNSGIPEPATLAMFVMGVTATSVRRRALLF